MSSVASAKRLVADSIDLGDRVADLVGRFQRPALGLFQRVADQVLERSHDAFEVLRLLDQPDREILQRGLPLQRVLEIALRRARAGPTRWRAACCARRTWLAIEATSRSVLDDSSVRRVVLASTRRAELAKVCAAFSVRRGEACRVLPVSRSSTLAGSALAASISSLSCELDAASRPIRSATLFGKRRCARLRRPTASRQCGWRAR